MKTARIISITLLALTLFVSSAFAVTTVSDLDVACERLAKELSKEFTRKPSSSGAHVDMRDFKRLDGTMSLLSMQIRAILAEELHDFSKDRFEVVNRAHSGTVHDALSDAGDDDFIIEIDGEEPKKVTAGDPVKAFFVVGSYRLGTKYLSITANIQDKNLRTLASAKVRVKISVDITTLNGEPVVEPGVRSDASSLTNVATSDRSANYLSLFTMNKGKSIPCGAESYCKLRVGSQMGFSVRPPMNSRIYVLNWDETGKSDEAIFLYPYPNMANKTFRKGNTYFFPEELDPDAASFEVEPPRGRMVFKIIGIDSNARMNLLQGVKQHEDGYYVLDAKGLAHIQRKLSTLPPGSWWEQQVYYWIN